MATVEAIRMELRQLGAEATAPGMAAVAVELATAFDEAEGSSAKAQVARELGAVMARLRALPPAAGAPGDAVNEIAEQRAKRRAAARGGGAGG
jgi:hypothetical protein